MTRQEVGTMVSLGGSQPRRVGTPRVDVAGLEVVLRGLRERLGVTQKQIADRAGVSPATIARLEAGDRRPSREVLARLAPVFATTPAGLIDAARQLAALPDDAVPADRDAVLAALPAAAEPVPPPPPVAAAWSVAADPLGTAAADPLGSVAADPLGSAAADPLGSAVADAERREGFARGVGDIEPVAAMPTGQLRYLAAAAVGQDERGRLWVDPLAPAAISGDDTRQPRVERYDDGRIVLDTGRLDAEVVFAPRDRARHRTHVVLASTAELPSPRDAEVFAEVVLELTTSPDARAVVAPAPPGTTEGGFPAGVTQVHVVTASNPRGRLLSVSENAERNRLLGAELERAGWAHHPAVVRSLSSSWVEQGFAVLDGDEAALRELAARYEQTAVHRWTPEHLAVVWVAGEQPTFRRGWVRTG